MLFLPCPRQGCAQRVCQRARCVVISEWSSLPLNPAPTEHERDHAEEEPSARRTRINEAGDAVPGSQDSISRGAQNLQLADLPAAQPLLAARLPPTMPTSWRPAQQRPNHQRASLQSAQRGADPARTHWTYRWWSRGHMSQTHGGQTLTQESVAQLLQLDRVACAMCGTTRSRRGNRCNHCQIDTATRDTVGNIY